MNPGEMRSRALLLRSAQQLHKPYWLPLMTRPGYHVTVDPKYAIHCGQGQKNLHLPAILPSNPDV